MYGNELNAAGQPLYFPWERAKDRRRQREALAKREAEKLFTKQETRLYTIYFFVWVVLTFIVGLTYHGVYHIVQPYTNYDLMKPHVNDGEPSLAMFVYEVIAALCVYCFHAHSKSWIDAYHSAVKRRNERRLAAAEAAAEAAAAELLADEPASRDDARAGLRRRAPRGRRRERARGAPPSAKKPAPAVAVPESKPEPPVAPESKTEEPPAAPEAKREEEETPAATAPPPGKKVLVDDDILDDAAAHARTLETSLTAHQAEVQRLKKVLKEQQREIPDAYLCPITMDPMEDPCIAADGHSYERRAIKDWFARGKRTSPKTGAQLDDTRLFPNHALKSAIQDFLEEVRRFDAATAGAQD